MAVPNIAHLLTVCGLLLEVNEGSTWRAPQELTEGLVRTHLLSVGSKKTSKGTEVSIVPVDKDSAQLMSLLEVISAVDRGGLEMTGQFYLA